MSPSVEGSEDFDASPIVPQVYPDGIRHIRADKRVNEWKTPGKKTIVRCAVNQRQVVIALTGGELVYFEMDPVRSLRSSAPEPAAGPRRGTRSFICSGRAAPF